MASRGRLASARAGRESADVETPRVRIVAMPRGWKRGLGQNGGSPVLSLEKTSPEATLGGRQNGTNICSPLRATKYLPAIQ